MTQKLWLQTSETTNAFIISILTFRMLQHTFSEVTVDRPDGRTF